MIVIIKPVLFAFIKSTAVKQLIVDLLEGLVSSTENTLDDKAVAVIKQALFPGGKQIKMANNRTGPDYLDKKKDPLQLFKVISNITKEGVKRKNKQINRIYGPKK